MQTPQILKLPAGQFRFYPITRLNLPDFSKSNITWQDQSHFGTHFVKQ